MGTLKGANGPVAGPDWRLERLGFVPTNLELLRRKHVMATPPGENGWLKLLGDFLYEQRGEVRGLLQTGGPAMTAVGAPYHLPPEKEQAFGRRSVSPGHR